MDVNSNSLTFKHVSHAADEELRYIQSRRDGTFKPLKTRWIKLNNTLCGGFESGTIITISGISGSGKSSFINSLENDLIDLNKDEDIVILNFSLEMKSSAQVARKLSYKLRKTTNELHSAINSVSDYEYHKISNEADKIKNYPIFYVDTPGTVEQIESTISKFREMYCIDKWLVIMYDHTLLTNPKAGEGDRETLVNLQKMFLKQKKLGKTTIFQLTQLNREIESDSRINNPQLHFPQRRDLSSSDSVYQASDCVLILHRPEILGIKAYGPNHWPVDGIIYLHCGKMREGEPKILSFKNNLKYNSIEEYDPTTEISIESVQSNNQ